MEPTVLGFLQARIQQALESRVPERAEPLGKAEKVLLADLGSFCARFALLPSLRGGPINEPASVMTSKMPLSRGLVRVTLDGPWPRMIASKELDRIGPAGQLEQV